jgi:hypothetical protein
MRVFHFPKQKTPISPWPDRLIAVSPEGRKMFAWTFFILVFASPGLSGLAPNAFISFLMLVPIIVFFLFFYLAMRRMSGLFRAEMVLPGFDNFFQEMAKSRPGMESFSVSVESRFYVKGHVLEIVTVLVHAQNNGLWMPILDLTPNEQRHIKKLLKQNPLKANVRIETLPAKGTAHQILQERSGLTPPKVRARSLPYRP